jgi:hypothetical protein
MLVGRRECCAGENSGWISQRTGAPSYGISFHENLNINVLQSICTLVVNYVVRVFAGLVTRAVSLFLVNLFHQLLPVSGEARHSFHIADFPSIC